MMSNEQLTPLKKTFRQNELKSSLHGSHFLAKKNILCRL